MGSSWPADAGEAEADGRRDAGTKVQGAEEPAGDGSRGVPWVVSDDGAPTDDLSSAAAEDTAVSDTMPGRMRNLVAAVGLSPGKLRTEREGGGRGGRRSAVRADNPRTRVTNSASGTCSGALVAGTGNPSGGTTGTPAGAETATRWARRATMGRRAGSGGDDTRVVDAERADKRGRGCAGAVRARGERRSEPAPRS